MLPTATVLPGTGDTNQETSSRLNVQGGDSEEGQTPPQPSAQHSLGRGVATAAGGASQGSTCTSRWVRRRTREENAAARLCGLWAASRHSRYWSNSQPRGLTPSSSGGAEEQAKAGRVCRARGEAGLDGRAEEEQRTTAGGEGARPRLTVCMGSADTWDTWERRRPWAVRSRGLGEAQ